MQQQRCSLRQSDSIARMLLSLMDGVGRDAARLQLRPASSIPRAPRLPEDQDADAIDGADKREAAKDQKQRRGASTHRVLQVVDRAADGKLVAAPHETRTLPS